MYSQRKWYRYWYRKIRGGGGICRVGGCSLTEAIPCLTVRSYPSDHSLVFSSFLSVYPCFVDHR